MGGKISLCMIVRDEEALLGQCLQSAKDITHEIVIVDTGSKDKTLDIAKSFGPKIFHLDWQDDFSAARNVSLEHASGDWILILDADEMLELKNLSEIANLTANSHIAGIQINVLSLNDQNKTIDQAAQVRLFRNHPSIRFQYRIHEQILPSLLAFAKKNHQRIESSRAKILHYGYTEKVKHNKNKLMRNLQIYAQQFKETPNNPYLLFRYAECLKEQDKQKSTTVLEKTIALLEAMPPETAIQEVYAAEVYTQYAIELLGKGEIEKANKLLLHAISRCIPSANLLYVMGILSLQLGNLDDALSSFKTLTKMENLSLQTPVQDGITSYIAYFCLGETYQRLAQYDKAALAYQEALKRNKNYRQAVKALAEIQKLLEANPNSKK